MSYPNNWVHLVNIELKIDERHGGGYHTYDRCGCKDCRLVRAGADAILEALRGSNEPSCEVLRTVVTGLVKGHDMTPVAYGKSYPGRWAFIPDEA